MSLLSDSILEIIIIIIIIINSLSACFLDPTINSLSSSIKNHLAIVDLTFSN
jgi:hypothetical protein